MQKTLIIFWSGTIWNGGGNMKPCFQLLVFGWTNIEDCWFQIETENFFSIVNMLTNLRRFWLQLNNLKKLIFVRKNQFNGARAGYKALLIW
jgi:hypothetical protein